MNEFEQYNNALAFATQKHSGQFRMGGKPYITHPVAVAEYVKQKGFGIEHQITGLFHDLLEDTTATEDEILSYSSKSVLSAVKLLTKYPGYNMADYIGEIRTNPIAFEVKAADRLHNLQCAVCANDRFKEKYILESVEWYLDFSPDIPIAIKKLAQSLGSSDCDLSFINKPVKEWQNNLPPKT